MREGYTVIDLKSVVDEAKKSEGFSNKSLLAATMASFPRAVFQTAVLNEDGDGFDNDYKGEQRLQASTRQKTGRKNKKQQALQRKLIGFVKQVEAAYPTWVRGPNDVILKDTVMVHQVPTGAHKASVQCLHTDFPMGPPSEPRGKLAVIVACDTCSILVTPYSHHMVRQFGNRRDDHYAAEASLIGITFRTQSVSPRIPFFLGQILQIGLTMLECQNIVLFTRWSLNRVFVMPFWRKTGLSCLFRTNLHLHFEPTVGSTRRTPIQLRVFRFRVALGMLP